MATQLAYIMSRFPGLTETFILREMSELEKLGIEILLLPLIRENDSVIHQEALPWMERAHFTRILSLTTVVANLKFIITHPVRWVRMLWHTISSNITNRKFLIRALYLLPKGIALADYCRQQGIEHIHAHYATHSAFLAWVISQVSGISYSITVHAHDIFVYQTMLAEKLKAAAFIISISEYNRRFLIETIDPQLADKIHVVHCGVRRKTMPARRELRGDNRGRFPDAHHRQYASL